MPRKTCIVIAGPTAVGKTAVSIALAQHLKTAIISADSRQCYRELDIGVAKPSHSQLEAVPHYFINSHSVTEEVNAGIFERYALAAVSEIFRHNDYALLVGGTGLYIKAFCEGMDDVPPAAAALRRNLKNQYEAEGMVWLQQQVAKEDPAWYANGEIHNPQRILRALEVIRTTGKSILDYHGKATVPREFDIIKIGLTLPREQLYAQINWRTDQMIDAGLVDEVRSLVQYRALNSLQTVGYREIFEYLNGTITLERAVEDIKRNTRHYAKRQLTWFTRDVSIKWFQPIDYGQLIEHLANLV